MTRVNPVVRSVLEDFDAALEASLGAPLAVYGLVPHSGEEGPVAAVAFVARTLGVPETDVLASAGIKERTFHDWKVNKRSPRLASQGKLWMLVQVAEDLAYNVPDVRAWFLADPSRRDQLRGGLFDELLSGTAARGFVEPRTASGYGVGREILVPPAPTPGRAFQRRPRAQRRTSRREG
jgi:hypothetical protein